MLGAWGPQSELCAACLGLSPRQTRSPSCPNLEEASQKALNTRILRQVPRTVAASVQESGWLLLVPLTQLEEELPFPGNLRFS